MSSPSPHSLAHGQLPPSPAPAANYLPVRECGGLLFVAGQTSHVNGILRVRGTVGDQVTADQARREAELAALNALSALASHLGSLEHLGGIISVTGFIAATPEFDRHPWVIDGASEAIIGFLGDRGRHARVALGVASLPDRAPVEVSIIGVRQPAG